MNGMCLCEEEEYAGQFPTDSNDAYDGCNCVRCKYIRTKNMDWKLIDADTPQGVVLHTKIVDENGERNVQQLKKQGNLWWTSDGKMYVYYTPTHWSH